MVTRPDRPRGRGRKLAAPPVAQRARELGLELAQPESVNGEEARAQIAAAAPEAVCVCAFGALIKEPLLSELSDAQRPSLAAAPLARRGADRARDHGRRSGDRSLDHAPDGRAGQRAGVCAGAHTDRAADSFGSLAARLQALGAELLIDVLTHSPPCHEQPSDGVTYAEKITPADRRLDPSRPADELERVVRALHPHIGAQIELAGGELLGVHEAQAVAEGGDRPRRAVAGGPAAAPGLWGGRTGAAHRPAPGQTRDER